MNSHNFVKGMQDILPPDVHIWQSVEAAARKIFGSCGFRKIRFPVLEYTEVFTRSIGDTSDIVAKEMYTFVDKGGRSVTMRPEGTASVVRSFVQHNLSHEMPPPQKFYYMGPMFRYERPQKGRLRQFYQIGVEAFGMPGPEIDAEIISMLMEFFAHVYTGVLTLEINSIGCPGCRPAFREALMEFFSPHREGLCQDCDRRLEENPLRVLDCKVPRCRELRKGAPSVTEYLCGDCVAHFEGLMALLDKLGIEYRKNPEMVRGLDYYTRTTFEVTTTELGAQSAVAAGGRYDRLVSEFGGPETPAIGFALGMERLVTLISEKPLPDPPRPVVFIASIGPEATAEALVTARLLRRERHWVELGYGASSLKSQMRRADKLRARYAVIIGEDELKSGLFSWKDMDGDASGRLDANGLMEMLRESSLNS
jgi:histidyl-tRNA synthetase